MRLSLPSLAVIAVAASSAVVVAQDATTTSAAASVSSTSSSATDSVSVSASSTASAALSTASVAPISTALIPGNITTTCSTFLNALNVDGNFTQCMQPLVNLTDAYSPAAASPGNATSNQQITATLTTLCSSSSGCSDALVRTYLAQFYSACGPELTGSSSSGSYNTQVRELYDFLYVLQPFRGAVCARDSGSAKYCVLEIANAALGAASNATSSAHNATSAATNGTLIALNSYATYASLAQEILGPVAQAAANLVVYTKSTASSAKRALRRDTVTQTSGIDASLISPNTTTYRTTSLPYLFLQPNMTSSLLCTTCTKVVMAAYASWEAQIPYALGLASSPILGSQAALWQGIEGTCGSNFTAAITQLAGILAANGTVVAATSAASTSAASMLPVLVAAFVGVAALLL